MTVSELAVVMVVHSAEPRRWRRRLWVVRNGPDGGNLLCFALSGWAWRSPRIPQPTVSGLWPMLGTSPFVSCQH